MLYTGDIVEILSLNHKQIEGIRSQRCDFNINPTKDVVGSRYRVAKRGCSPTHMPLIGWGHGGHGLEISFSEAQLLLYNRPIKNHIKHFLFISKKEVAKIKMIMKQGFCNVLKLSFRHD